MEQFTKGTITDTKDVRLITWFSRILRWVLGIVFVSAGIIYFDQGAWPAILFGAVIFITGFFRPKRCLEESCER